MVKKKYFLLLSTLLLTALLGLSGTCYATELTNNMVNNFILNYYNYYYGSNGITEFKQWLDGSENQTIVDSWVERINRDNFYSANRWLLTGHNGSVILWYVNGNDTQISQHPPYVRNDRFTANVNNSYYVGWQRSLNIITKEWNNVANTAVNEQPLGTDSNINYAFFYTDMNLYYFYSSTPQTIRYPIGYESQPGLLEGYYSDDYFAFLLSSSLDTITIDGDSVPVYDFQTNQAQSFILGQLGLAENFDYAELFEYRWHWDRWKLNKITKLNNIGPVTDNLIAVTINGSMTNSNTLYSLQMNSDPDSDFTNISQPFYIKNRDTVIANGALDIGATFSGDYGLIYNNDTNTQSILDTLTDEQKENAALNDFDTILSGDASDVAGNLGFVNLASGGSGFFPLNIYTRLTDYFDQITDVLLESQPQTFSFYLHDNTGQIVLNTNDFITPNGPLKVFMQLFLVTCTIFVVWNQFYRYYELLSTFNVVLLMHDLDVEKTVFRM